MCINKIQHIKLLKNYFLLIYTNKSLITNHVKSLCEVVFSVGGECGCGSVFHSCEVHEVRRTMHLVVELARVAELDAVLHIWIVSHTYGQRLVALDLCNAKIM